MVNPNDIKQGDRIKFTTLDRQGKEVTAVRPVTFVTYGAVTVTKFDNQRQFVVMAHEIKEHLRADRVRSW